MIRLTKLNQDIFYLNPFLIETIEETPDTVITLTNGKKVVVTDKAEKINEQIVGFYKEIYYTPPKIITY